MEPNSTSIEKLVVDFNTVGLKDTGLVDGKNVSESYMKKIEAGVLAVCIENTVFFTGCFMRTWLED